MYLVAAPYFKSLRSNEIGAPVRSDIDLPLPSTNLEMVSGVADFVENESNDDMYEIKGWAFSRMTPDEFSDIYRTEVVLFSTARNYVFDTRETHRPELNEKFSDLELQLRNIGFQGLINQEVLRQDDYCVGILLTHLERGNSYFQATDQILSKGISAAQVNRDVDELCDGYLLEGMGKPNSEEITAPSPASEGDVLNGITGFGRYREWEGIYQMSGWAFYTLDPDTPTDRYPVEIMLFSNGQTLVFPANRAPRTRLEEKLRPLNLNLRNIGFWALIDQETLDQTAYCVGLLLTNPADNSHLFVKTNAAITDEAGQLNLLQDAGMVCEGQMP